MNLKQLVEVILIVSAFALAGMDKVDAADWMQQTLGALFQKFGFSS